MDAKDDKIDDAESTDSAVFPIPAAQRAKRYGMDFYTNTLGAPKYVVSVYLSDLLNTQCLNLENTNGIKSIISSAFLYACVCVYVNKYF